MPRLPSRAGSPPVRETDPGSQQPPQLIVQIAERSQGRAFFKQGDHRVNSRPDPADPVHHLNVALEQGGVDFGPMAAAAFMAASRRFGFAVRSGSASDISVSGSHKEKARLEGKPVGSKTFMKS